MSGGRIAIGVLVVFLVSCLAVPGVILAIPSHEKAASCDSPNISAFLPGTAAIRKMDRSFDTASLATGPEAATVQIAAACGIVRYDAEIADTDARIERGLMYRTALAPDAGMLFVFRGDKNRYFWMENTLLPLDLIYISSRRRVVGIRENARPESADIIPPPGPSQYVLEVCGGQCRQYGIGKGDAVAISYSAGHRY